MQKKVNSVENHEKFELSALIVLLIFEVLKFNVTSFRKVHLVKRQIKPSEALGTHEGYFDNVWFLEKWQNPVSTFTTKLRQKAFLA